MLSKTKIENNIEEIQDLSCESFGRKTIGFIYSSDGKNLKAIADKLVELGAKENHIKCISDGYGFQYGTYKYETISECQIDRLDVKISYHKAFGWEK